MIQRIQTIFLFLATILVVIAISTPLYFLQVHLEESSSGIEFISNLGLTQQVVITEGKGDVTVDIYKTIALAMIGFVCLITIFLFKNRSLQLRLLKLNMLACVLYAIGIFYFGYKFIQSDATFQITSYSVKSAGSIALACLLLLNVLAHKFIKKDDELVKSADRFRG